jgi:amino-acid N-acetyltransferase
MMTPMPSVPRETVVDRARPDDAPGILALLNAHGLPPDDLERHLATAVVVRQAGDVVGSAALEIYQDGALLRSVAVAPGLQGQGLGRKLTAAAIDLARTLGTPALYLLTTTAQGYFPGFGFDQIQRADVPASVQASVEFTGACPSTAVVMRKQLTPTAAGR